MYHNSGPAWGDAMISKNGKACFRQYLQRQENRNRLPALQEQAGNKTWSRIRSRSRIKHLLTIQIKKTGNRLSWKVRTTRLLAKIGLPRPAPNINWMGMLRVANAAEIVPEDDTTAADGRRVLQTDERKGAHFPLWTRQPCPYIISNTCDTWERGEDELSRALKTWNKSV